MSTPPHCSDDFCASNWESGCRAKGLAAALPSLSKLGDQLRLWQAGTYVLQKKFEALRSCGRSGLHDDVGARAFDDCL